jgi:hypothetical protein
MVIVRLALQLSQDSGRHFQSKPLETGIRTKGIDLAFFWAGTNALLK